MNSHEHKYWCCKTRWFLQRCNKIEECDFLSILHPWCNNANSHGVTICDVLMHVIVTISTVFHHEMSFPYDLVSSFHFQQEISHALRQRSGLYSASSMCKIIKFYVVVWIAMHFEIIQWVYCTTWPAVARADEPSTYSRRIAYIPANSNHINNFLE